MQNGYSMAVGVSADRDQVLSAVKALSQMGFGEDQVGVAVRGVPGIALEDQPTQAAQGALRGVIRGGVVGGLLGAASALIAPGIGPVVAGGLLGTALAGAALMGSTGAVAGGLIGTLTSLGIPEEEARYSNNEVKAGRVLVVVKANSRYDEAQEILRRCGAYDVETRLASG